MPLGGTPADGDNAIMSVAPAAYSSNSMRAEKRAVAWNSVMAALAITTLKIVGSIYHAEFGITFGSSHSGLDLIAAIVTLLSIRVSDKPADADHQYGHGKVENFSAFIETGLLLLTCVWIVYEAVKRLFFHHVEIEPSAAAFSGGSLFPWRSTGGVRGPWERSPRSMTVKRWRPMLCIFPRTFGPAA